MEFGITKEEIQSEIAKIKEEQRIKEILQNQLEEITKSFGKRFDDFQIKISEEVSSKDKEIESLNLELTSLKETIETLNRENLDLKSRILSVNDLVLSTQKKKIDPSPHSEEFFSKIKVMIRNSLKRLYEDNRYKNESFKDGYRKVLNISENEVNSPISKYIINKIEKYFKKTDSRYNKSLYQYFYYDYSTSLFKEYFSKEIELAKNKYSISFELIHSEMRKITVNLKADGFNRWVIDKLTQDKMDKLTQDINKLTEKQFEYFLTILP
jgi:hypothetical protein